MRKALYLHLIVLYLCLTVADLWAQMAPDALHLNTDGTLTYRSVTIDPDLHEWLLQSSDAEETLVLTFTDADLTATARPKLMALGAEFVGPDFQHLPIQGVRVTTEEAWKLADVEGVFGMWRNKNMNTEMHQAVIVSSVKDTWEDMSFTDLNGGLPLSGRGVGVLVNDSGFDGMDTDLDTSAEGEYNERIVQNVKGLSVNWAEDSGADNDQGGGHGSHCMGIVGGDGRRSDGKIVGVAPGAYLIGYGSGAGLNILDVAGGFEYVLAHRKDYNIRVMSNSYGSTSDTTFTAFNPAHTTAVATKALADAGVIVVFSAGNSGPTDGKITGVFKTSPWLICVGNGTKDGKLASSSSPGRPDPVHPAKRDTITVNGTDYLWENRPAVTAPGTDIVSVRASASAIQGLSALDDIELEPSEIPYYTVLSGTSMACPHVAGIVALMLEANPQLEWRAVKAILQRTAIDDMEEQVYQRGAGYVNAHAAVAAAYHGLCATGIEADYDLRYGLPTDGSFGFDDDPWKDCTLHPEVASRIKTAIPTAAGVEAECAAGPTVLTDDTGDATAPYFDVTEVRFHDETSNDFKVTLALESNLLASPSSTPGTGSQHYYDVHFTLSKAVPDDPNAEVTPNVTYVLSSYKELLTEKFILTVKSGEDNTRPSRNPALRDEISGNWDTVNNTITWTVPKALLNYSEMPLESTTTSPAARNSRPARATDQLGHWGAYLYERPGTITPDGLGVYNDSAEGDCYKVLTVD